MKKGEDYIGVSVVYFCHDGKGNFVMAKRSSQARDENGKWDIGSGGLKFGETVEEGLRREINEEYCTEVIDYDFLGFQDVHRIHDNKPTHWIALCFKVLVDPLKVKVGEPEIFDEIGWFTFNLLPENLHSQNPKFFAIYKDKLI